jgi:hypothetical protein
MKKGCFTLPRNNDTQDTLAGAKWFSTMDLHPDDKENTAISMSQWL